MLSQGGRGVKNCQFYLVKRLLRGGEGVNNCQFWDDIVYGRPLMCSCLIRIIYHCIKNGYSNLHCIYKVHFTPLNLRLHLDLNWIVLLLLKLGAPKMQDHGLGNLGFLRKRYDLTSVSKKPGQTTVLYHYCSLSRFFWNRRYYNFFITSMEFEKNFS